MPTRQETWEALFRCGEVRDRQGLERARRHAKRALNEEMDRAVELGLDFAYRVIYDQGGMPGWDRDRP